MVFISRGNVRKNNGFPRLIMLIDVFQFLSILLWEDAELLLEAFGEILRRVEAHLGCHFTDQNVRVRPDDVLSFLQADAGDEAMTVCPVVAFTLLYKVDSLITISLAKESRL